MLLSFKMIIFISVLNCLLKIPTTMYFPLLYFKKVSVYVPLLYFKKVSVYVSDNSFNSKPLRNPVVVYM